MRENIPPEMLKAIFIIFSNITKTTNAIEEEDKSQKRFFEEIGMNEQTYYSWVRKNPKLVQIIHDGYVMQAIKDDLAQGTFVIDSYNRSQKVEAILSEILSSQ